MCDAFNNANDKIANILCDGDAITNDLTAKIVCDVPMNGNVFLAANVWNVYTNGNVSGGLTVWDVLTTGNDFACIIVFFSSTIRITVFSRPPVTHDILLKTVCVRPPGANVYHITVCDGQPLPHSFFYAPCVMHSITQMIKFLISCAMTMLSQMI